MFQASGIELRMKRKICRCPPYEGYRNVNTLLCDVQIVKFIFYHSTDYPTIVQGFICVLYLDVRYPVTQQKWHLHCVISWDQFNFSKMPQGQEIRECMCIWLWVWMWTCRHTCAHKHLVLITFPYKERQPGVLIDFPVDLYIWCANL